MEKARQEAIDADGIKRRVLSVDALIAEVRSEQVAHVANCRCYGLWNEKSAKPDPRCKPLDLHDAEVRLVTIGCLVEELEQTEGIRKLYEFGGIRLERDAVGTLRKICRTPRSGRLRTCSHIIAALHTARVVDEAGLIDAKLIIAAIDQLDLPVKVYLPISGRGSIKSSDADQVEQKAKTA